MTPIEVAWLLASAFTAAGILLWIVARPMAKLSVWWQSLCIRVLRLQFLSKFMYDERTSVVIVRVVGVSFIVIGIFAAILAVVLPYAR